MICNPKDYKLSPGYEVTDGSGKVIVRCLIDPDRARRSEYSVLVGDRGLHIQKGD